MVKFFRNESAKAEPNPKVLKRVKVLDTPSVMSWWDTCHMNLGASFDKWRYQGGPWQDVQENMDALNTLWAELRTRSDIN